MSRKKIIALVMSALLAVCAVGASLAWFHSQDTVSNRFATIGTPDEPGGSDIKIVEKFTPPEDVKPGDTTTKAVQVKNIDNYNQLIRVHFKVSLLDANGGEVSQVKAPNGTVITTQNLKDNLTFNLSNTITTEKTAAAGKWFTTNTSKPQDAYYYYLGYVSPDKCTSKLLESVKLSLNAGNEYQGIKYKVDVIADGVQAANGAFKEEFKTPAMDDDLIKALSDAENTDGSQAMDKAIADAQN